MEARYVSLPLKDCTKEFSSDRLNLRRKVLSLLDELKECGRRRDLQRGRELHSRAVSSGLFLEDTYLHSGIINMYAKCRSMIDARKLFDALPDHSNVVCWNCLLQGYVDNGECESALDLFHRLTRSAPGDVTFCLPDARTYVAALIACATLAARQGNPGSTAKWLEKGKEIHHQAMKNRCCDNIFVQNTLIDMYGKCGCMAEARCEFDRMLQRNSVSWTALLQGYVYNGQSEEALQLFDEMLQRENSSGGCVPNARTYAAALTACAALAGSNKQDADRLIDKGQDLHSRAVKHRCCDIFVETTLVDLYARCGSMTRARNVFDRMVRRNAVTWTALLQGYVQNGQSEVALELFDKMTQGFTGNSADAPNSRTYIAALSACAALAAAETTKQLDSRWFERGKAVHSAAKKNQCGDNVFVQNTLIDMYGKCGRMVEARSVFDDMSRRTTVTWTALLQGYVENGDSKRALELFHRMDEEAADDCLPNARTCVFALTACASLAAAKQKPYWIDKVKMIHSTAVKHRCGQDIYVQNTLVDVYAQLGSTELARSVFDEMHFRDTVSWNALLQGYAENNQSELALDLFLDMEMNSECVPNARTYVAALTACVDLVAKKDAINIDCLELGRMIHSRAVRTSCCDVFVETSLTNLYAKCRRMVLARCVFDNTFAPTVVTWNCLIQGYVDNGDSEYALQTIQEMKVNGVSANSATFVAALTACGKLMAAETGKRFHEEIRKLGLHRDDLVATWLVDFYGRCGCLEEAKEVFESIAVKGLCAWNALIAGYSQRGGDNVMEVFQVFETMRDGGVAPDEITCTHLLSACSHAGLVERGKELFSAMPSKYGVIPNLIHCNCIVDLLARANQIDEALEFVKDTMPPFQPNAVTWTSILGGCRKWNNAEVGKLVYNRLLALNEKG